MPIENDALRDRLLGRGAVPVDAARYRANVSQLIQQNQKRIRRERVFVTAFWIFCAVSATVRLWFSADSAKLPKSPFLACIFLTWGGVEVVKHYIHACRVDLLSEIKQLQVQVLELEQSRVSHPGSAAGD